MSMERPIHSIGQVMERLNLRRFRFFEEFRTGIPREQLFALAEQTGLNFFVTLAVVLIATGLIYFQIGSPWILFWASIQMGVVSLVGIRRFSSRNKRQRTHLDMSLSRSGILHATQWAGLSGSLWGSLVLFFPQATLFQQIEILLVVGGMAAGSSATLASVQQAAVSFILGCMLPIITYLLFFGVSTQIMWAAMAIVFSTGMIATSQISNRSLVRQLNAEYGKEKLQRALFQEKLAHAISTERDVDKALEDCLTSICEYLGWPVGHAYFVVPDSTHNFTETGLWHLDDPIAMQPFCEVSKQLPIYSKNTLIEKIIETQQPFWLTRLDADTSFRRLEVAIECGLQTIFAFPVISNDRVIAVLEFYTDQLLKSDTNYLEMAGPIGNQVGRAIERHHADNAIRESEQRLRTLIEHSVQGVFIHDRGRPIFVNDEGARMFGLSKEEFLSKEFMGEVLHLKDHEKARQAMRNRESNPGVPAIAEYVGEHKEHGEFPVYTKTIDINWNGQPATLVTGIDLTELKQTQSTLEEREQELTRVNRGLVLASQQANAANAAKSEFLMAMSHELRTPLNAILGFSEIMTNRACGKITEQQTEYAQHIHDSGKHLLSLVNDVLELANIDSGSAELQTERIDIGELVNSTMGLFRHQADKAQVKITTEVERGVTQLFVDGRKLKQVIMNLIDNAIKFNEVDGQVAIGLKNSRDGIAIWVRDTGIGMALEDIPTALSRFGQVDSTVQRKYDGTGLGLALSAALVELHGGHLEVDSKVGQGTTVSVCLPQSCVFKMDVASSA